MDQTFKQMINNVITGKKNIKDSIKDAARAINQTY
jgi:maltose-binding protein MalE